MTLTLKGISKKYDSRSILDNFEFEFKSSSLIVIAGESGSGKSTLLNIIGLLVKPDSGSILHDDKEILKLKGASKRDYLQSGLGYLFQNYALVDDESVRDNLKIGSAFNKDNDNDKSMEKALEKVKLQVNLERKVYSLSGGEQQRVALARLLLKRFDILLADEPTGNLDKENAEIVIGLLKDIRDQNKIVIVAHHDQLMIQNADAVIYL